MSEKYRSDNILEGGSSNNNVAGKDLTINNQYGGVFDGKIFDFIAPQLKINLEGINSAITNHVICSLNDKINEKIIDPLEIQVKAENLHIHIHNIYERLGDKSEYDSKTDLTNKQSYKARNSIKQWLDIASEVDSEDKELSSIIEGWFVAYQKSNFQDDELRELLSIIKSLTPKEGILLFAYDRRNNKKHHEIFERFKEDPNLPLIYKKLKEKGLIKTDTKKIVLQLLNLLLIATLIYIGYITTMRFPLFSGRLSFLNLDYQIFYEVMPIILISTILMQIISRGFGLLKRIENPKYTIQTEIGERIINLTKKQ